MRPQCDSQKKVYLSRRIAILGARWMTAKFNKKSRAYKCQMCSGWHLTTMTNEQFEQSKYGMLTIDGLSELEQKELESIFKNYGK